MLWLSVTPEGKIILEERTDTMNPGSTYHKEQVLNFLMYHLQPDMRRKLMHELPLAYNDVVGHTVMGVVNTSVEDAPIISDSNRV